MKVARERGCGCGMGEKQTFFCNELEKDKKRSLLWQRHKRSFIAANMVNATFERNVPNTQTHTYTREIMDCRTIHFQVLT